MDEEEWGADREGKAVLLHNNNSRMRRVCSKWSIASGRVPVAKSQWTKDWGGMMSCKSVANAVVVPGILVSRASSMRRGSSSSYGTRRNAPDENKVLNSNRNPSNGLAKAAHLKSQGSRAPPGDHHHLELLLQQQGDVVKGFSSGQMRKRASSTAAAAGGPTVTTMRESKESEMIASLKQKLEHLTTKVMVMEEQSAAAAAEEAQTLATMHDILQRKDREIASLRDQLAHLKTNKIMLLQQKSPATTATTTKRAWDGTTTTTTPTGSYRDDDTAPSPKILLSATSGVKEAAHSFTKTFMQKMLQIPDLKNRTSLEDRIRKDSGDVLLSSENHAKFLVQAFICRRLYAGFENESFNIESCSSSSSNMSTNNNNGCWDVKQYAQNCFKQFQLYRRNVDTVSILINNEPHDDFLRQFCFEKFQTVIDERTELLLFGNNQHSAKITRHNKHPCTDFYQSFCKLAVSVWLVHRLAFSFDYPARIFRARKGQAFQASFMTSVVPWTAEDEEAETGASVVGVMVLPGFRVSKSIVETEVYLEHNHT